MRRGSRLFKSLIREQEVASDVSAFTWDLSRGADLFVVDATARPEIDAATLERAVVAEIDKLHTQGVSDDEVSRVMALIETDYVSSLQTAGDRADTLSKFATFLGDPSLVNEQLDKYRAVTAAQVTAFARTCLGADNRASLVYLPRTTPEGE
jgi:predicted Zn-dependent peptidase